uniref:Reverse transcriptase domain-containing protein n=1 Tax=Tanacetum cinerariifolium TaxID=118510 RepID=A0A6L2M2D9_TANCI|nr:hypothetical protein [Tanacetum cinerariifolium]
MRTHSSFNLPVKSPPNPSTSNPKRRNRRRSNQPFILEESPIYTMADQRTMAELLRAHTKGYTKAIVVLSILAEQFELKHSLINMMTSDQFFGLEKDNPHDHIRWFNKITSTIKCKDVPNSAWDRYKDLLRACPRHDFTELHQLDTFYNALNLADQDSLNSAAGGNLLERRTQDVLTIIENKSKVRSSRNKSVVSQVKSSDANANSSFEIANITHAVNQQTSDVTTAMTAILKQFQATPPPASIKAVEEIYVTCGGAHPYYQCPAVGGNTFPELRDNIQGYVAAAAVNYNQVLGSLPSNTIANPKGELKAITTRSGIVLNGPSVPIPPPFINPKEDERVEEKQTRITLSIPSRLKALLSNKEKLQELPNTPLNENFLAVILNKLLKKHGDPGKFLIPYSSNELKCKALADLANQAICTPTGIARDVFVPVGKFTFPSDFVIVDYESDPRVPLILGRPFLWTTRSLIDVQGEEMILRDVKNDVFDPDGGNVLPKKLLDLDSTKDLHPSHHINPLSGSTTFSFFPNHLLEEFADELTLVTFPPEYDLSFDIESDLKEIEYMLYQYPIKDMNSNLKDSVDQIESDTENVYDDPFDSKEEKIKESKLLVDELDLPCDFLFPSEYDTILSEDFSKVDAFPLIINEDKNEKKLAMSNASLMLEDFDPPLYELPFFKEAPMSKMLLLFSSENEEKVCKPRIHTSKKVHSSFITELSHQGYKFLKA